MNAAAAAQIKKPVRITHAPAAGPQHIMTVHIRKQSPYPNASLESLAIPAKKTAVITAIRTSYIRKDPAAAEAAAAAAEAAAGIRTGIVLVRMSVILQSIRLQNKITSVTVLHIYCMASFRQLPKAESHERSS